MGARFAVRPRGTRPGSDVVYEFDQARVVIGRGHGADVRLPHPSVSHGHAIVRQQGMGYVLLDEGSTNGTRVNEQRVVPNRPKVLRDGDRIRIGTFELGFRSGLAVAEGTSVERTAALARRFVREMYAEEGPDGIAPARLRVVEGPDRGRTIEPPDGGTPLVIGRGDGCDVVLSDADISREHLSLLSDAEGPRLEDLGSKNGILVNGRAARARRLRDGDEIRLGSTLLVFEDPAEARLRALDAEPDVDLPADPAPEADPDREPTPATPPAQPADAETRTSHLPARRTAGADLIIYALAGGIFAASLAGLLYLLQG
ncbi:MAG: FHA domain-containing protein [Myxococcota bacterium]